MKWNCVESKLRVAHQPRKSESEEHNTKTEIPNHIKTSE